MSAQPVNIKQGLPYNHTWKLVGFVYPLHDFNYPISISTGMLVAKYYIVASQLAVLDLTCNETAMIMLINLIAKTVAIYKYVQNCGIIL